MSPLLRRQLILFSAIGGAFMLPIWWLFYRPAGILDVLGYHLGRDFINMWAAPQVIDRFGVMTILDLKAYHWALSDIVGFMIRFHNWSYPIDVLFIAYPLSWMPYLPALLLWTVTGLAIYLCVVGSRIPVEQRKLALLFLAIAPATIVNIIGGQNGFFTTGLILGAIALLERRPYVAGILVGLLTMKPHLGLVLGFMLIAVGAWRTILAAGVTASLLVGASIAVFGIEPWVAYMTRTSAYTWRILLDFEGFQTFMELSVLVSLRAFGISPDIAKWVQAVVSVVVIVTSVMAFRRTHDVALRALLVASATFLASPYVFNYDLPILTAAILWVTTSRPVTDREAFVLGGAWVAPSALWVLHMSHLGLSPFLIGGAFMLCVRLIYRENAMARQPIAVAGPIAQPA